MNRKLKVLLAAAAAVAIPAIINEVIFLRRRSLDTLDGLEGEEFEFPWTWGRVRYCVRGSGPPVLLLHGIYAGASSYEWRSNFDALAEEFTVFAPDLLGFGESDKPDAPYSGHLYTRLIEDFSREVIGEPCYIAASSLSAAFAVAANTIVPVARKLALVCPAGITHLSQPDRLPGWAMYGLLETPILGTSIYNRITSQNGIRGYLKNHVYADPERVDSAMVAYMHTVAHQPGAQFAADAFIAGRLNLEISQAFARIDVPTLILWGRHARMTPVSDAQEFLDRNPRAALNVFENSALLPHDEEPGLFNEVVKDFFADASVGETESDHRPANEFAPTNGKKSAFAD